MISKFWEWISLKQKLHYQSPKPPLVKEQDLWWVSLGENVGSEINGKSDLFSRPALVMKKLSNTLFLVAPTTTKLRQGSWYVQIKFADRVTNVCLQQIRVIDYRRLSNRMGKIDANDYKAVKYAFINLYK